MAEWMGVEVVATVKELAKTGRDLGGMLGKGLARFRPRAGFSLRTYRAEI